MSDDKFAEVILADVLADIKTGKLDNVLHKPEVLRLFKDDVEIMSAMIERLKVLIND